MPQNIKATRLGQNLVYGHPSSVCFSATLCAYIYIKSKTAAFPIKLHPFRCSSVCVVRQWSK